jgi:hypothetical protein
LQISPSSLKTRMSFHSYFCNEIETILHLNQEHWVPSIRYREFCSSQPISVLLDEYDGIMRSCCVLRGNSRSIVFHFVKVESGWKYNITVTLSVYLILKHNTLLLQTFSYIHKIIWKLISWVKASGWLFFNVKCAICQLYHGENKLHFNETVMMMSALYKNNTLTCIV